MKKTYRTPRGISIAVPPQCQPLATSEAYRVNSYETAEEENLGGDNPTLVKNYIWDTNP